jgi:hypothetical protein
MGWNSGLSKYTDPRIMKTSESVKKTMLENSIGFQRGYTPWNKGITIDRDSPEYFARVVQLREASKRRVFNESSRLKMSESGKKLYLSGKKMPEFHGPHTLAAKLKMSIARKGKRHNKEWVEKIGNALRGRKCTEETIKKILAGSTIKPNKGELKLFSIVSSLFPDEYALNIFGNILILDGKVPDIVNINGRKKIIELFGEHWHERTDEQKRKDCFGQYGWDTLVIWWKELRNRQNVEKKLIEFHGGMNGQRGI